MWALFKDKNDINEKNVIGFASFIVMTLFAIADLLTSLIADKDLIINEVVTTHLYGLHLVALVYQL